MAVNRHTRTSNLSKHPSDTLQIGLAAMQEIGVVLGRLDEPTRARVLRWTQERFEDAAPVAAVPAPLHAVPGPRPVPDARQSADEGADDSLSVTTLNDFFTPKRKKALKKTTTEATGQSVTGMLHDFVAEFQDVVREWNVACDGPGDAGIAEPVRSIAS